MDASSQCAHADDLFCLSVGRIIYASTDDLLNLQAVQTLSTTEQTLDDCAIDQSGLRQESTAE